MSGQRADGRHEEVEEGGVKAEGVRDRSNDNDMEQTGPTQVLESVRSGAGSGIGGPGQGERNHGLDPRELAPFLNALDQYHPTIPEEVTAYFLQQGGVTVTDSKIKKLVSLAAEKLVSEIVHDTTTYSRMKDQDGDILKMEDLRESLGKYGVEKFKIRATEEEKKEEEGGKGGGGEVAFGGEKSLGSGREGRGGGGGRRAPSRNS